MTYEEVFQTDVSKTNALWGLWCECVVMAGADTPESKKILRAKIDRFEKEFRREDGPR